MIHSPQEVVKGGNPCPTRRGVRPVHGIAVMALGGVFSRSTTRVGRDGAIKYTMRARGSSAGSTLASSSFSSLVYGTARASVRKASYSSPSASTTPLRCDVDRKSSDHAMQDQQDYRTASQVVSFIRLVVAQGWERHRQSLGGSSRESSCGDTSVAAECSGVDSLILDSDFSVSRRDDALSESGSHISLKDLIEEQERERYPEDDESDPVALNGVPPDLLPYLRTVGIAELNHLRAMSMLSTLTYGMEHKVNESRMRRLGLEFVTSSLVWERCLVDCMRLSEETRDLFACGDGMSMNFSVSGIQGQAVEEVVGTQREGHAHVRTDVSGLSTSGRASTKYGTHATPSDLSCKAKGRVQSLEYSGTELEVSFAHMSASRTAMGEDIRQKDILQKGKYRHGGQHGTKQLNNISYFGNGVLSKTSHGAVTENTWDPNGSSKKLPARSSDELNNHPTHWYVADDRQHDVRYFVIQGSDNVDHWKLNLTFDPVQFESLELGMKAHRGVYEAACTLYDVFLPLVTDFIESNPRGTIAFTGHSLGGSLGTMLMLMFYHRGVLTAAELAPVHTFGSPAVFCGGEGCNGQCSVNGGRESQGVLEKLGLPHDAIRNVIMHKDIVPRAFACDYSILADFLKRIHASFRDHTCLHGKRSVMFNTIGQTLIVQPHERSSFVKGEGYHPLLPKGPQLVALKHSNSRDQLCSPPVANVIHDENGIGQEVASKETQLRELSSTDEAYWELMNSPHPLKILSNTNAYGDNGSISRYHNPSNYTKALGGVLKSRMGENAQNILLRMGKHGNITYRPSLDRERRNDTYTGDK
jgi:hypothetical protein